MDLRILRGARLYYPLAGEGTKLGYKAPIHLGVPNIEGEAYPCSYLSEIAIRLFYGVWLEGWIHFLFRQGSAKDGEQCCRISYFVPFSRQRGGERKMRWILACFKFILFSHSGR